MTIKQKQCLLYYLGYYTGAVDGIWGNNSKKATTELQEAEGLKADGDFGDATAEAAISAVANGRFKKTTTTTTKTETSGTFWDEIKYFEKSEFACKCGCGADNMNETLIRVADRVRDHFGSPMTVSSGRRCAKHNARVGGVSNSRHTTDPGKAMDFCVKGKTSAQVLAYVQKQPEIRYAYAIDGSYVHMDVN